MKKIISTILSILLISVITISSITYKVKAIEGENMYVENIKDVEKITICIDPGHQSKLDSSLEPIAPGSSQKKPKVSAGTAGVGTKKAEYIVNLEASMILKDILVERGYEVIMTRESHDVKISNAERAEVANRAEADMTIRIHCDSIEDSGKTGASILVPAKDGKYTKSIYESSHNYGVLLKEALNKSGVKVCGVFERADISGFNWSKVPVVILEMGFMSNWNEDQMLCNPEYQRKLMTAVADSLDQYKSSISNFNDNNIESQSTIFSKKATFIKDQPLETIDVSKPSQK